MEQRDYKAIADIINQYAVNLEMVEELADYFEKNYKNFYHCDCEVCIKDSFNRKQFLKDCGVK